MINVINIKKYQLSGLIEVDSFVELNEKYKCIFEDNTELIIMFMNDKPDEDLCNLQFTYKCNDLRLNNYNLIFYLDRYSFTTELKYYDGFIEICENNKKIYKDICSIEKLL